MALTFATMLDYVRSNIKRDAADPVGAAGGYSDDKIKQTINWAQREIANRYTFEEMRNTYDGATIVDQRYYGFPANMKDIYSLVLVDGTISVKLRYLNAREYDELRPAPEEWSSQKPYHYIDYGKNFELAPIPDAIYSMVLRASDFPTVLSADADESDLDEKDDLIISVATWAILFDLREVEFAEWWENGRSARLWQAALRGDHSSEDWTPVARGFMSTGEGGGGDYTNPWWGRRRW